MGYPLGEQYSYLFAQNHDARQGEGEELDAEKTRPHKETPPIGNGPGLGRDHASIIWGKLSHPSNNLDVAQRWELFAVENDKSGRWNLTLLAAFMGEGVFQGLSALGKLSRVRIRTCRVFPPSRSTIAPPSFL